MNIAEGCAVCGKQFDENEKNKMRVRGTSEMPLCVWCCIKGLLKGPAPKEELKFEAEDGTFDIPVMSVGGSSGFSISFSDGSDTDWREAGELLRSARISLGLSPSSAGNLSGTDEKTVLSIENGGGEANADTAYKLELIYERMLCAPLAEIIRLGGRNVYEGQGVDLAAFYKKAFTDRENDPLQEVSSPGYE